MAQDKFGGTLVPNTAPSKDRYGGTLVQGSSERPERTWGQAIKDTGAQLAEGVNTALGAVPDLIAPDSGASQFFRDNAEHWREAQSDPLKQRMAATGQRIQEAGKDGVLSQVGTAISEYWNDPAQAARLVATNLPSMVPGLAAGKAAQVASAARGASAAQQAAAATGVASAANAAMNAGGARGEAFDDLQKAHLAQGAAPDQARDAALSESLLPAAVGGVAGAVSGKIGLERAVLGQAGAGSVARKAAGAAGAELAGEQIEEVAPQVATNFQVGRVDGTRGLTDDVGRTMVETAIGAGPGAVVAGGVEGMRTADASRAGVPALDPGTAPVAEPEWDTAPGAAAPRPVAAAATESAPVASALEPDFQTSPGAAPDYGPGLDFRRDIDTNGLALAGDTATPSQRMGIDPAAGPLSAGAALAVDSGASDQLQQASVLAEAADVVAKAPDRQKEERKPQAPQGADPETGEIPGPDNITSWSDTDLSTAFRGAQSREVRLRLAQELQRRRGERELRDLQAELDAEQAGTVPGADGADTAFARVSEDAGTAPAALAPTTEGTTDGRTSAANPRTQGAPAPGAQVAEESREQRAQRIDSAGQTWTRLPALQRQVVAEQLNGVKPILQKNLSGAKWENLNSDLKRKIADLIAPAAPASQASAAIDDVAVQSSSATKKVASSARRTVVTASNAAGAASQKAVEATKSGAESAAPLAISDAAHEAATSSSNDLPAPTAAQIEAGNYKKGHARVAGLDISIESPAGSRRRPEWPPLLNHYGYIKGTKGADKDHVDVFMTDRADDASLPVFVVDQVNQDGSFDEHKVVMGAADESEARSTYLGNYQKGWTGLGAVTQMTQDEFKAWVRDPAKTTRPAETLRGEAAIAEQQQAIKAHGLPEGTEFKPGKGALGDGKWTASVGGQSGSLAATVDEAARSLAAFMSMDRARAAAEEKRQALAGTVADKLKRGEKPTDVELRDLFGLAPHHTYVDQSAVGQFLVDHMGVARNGIRKALGAAAGDRTSDGGTKYPIVYPRKLHEVFGAQPAPDVTAPRKPRGILAKKAAAEEAARADYFMPGNIVKSYGGHDRVVSYAPPDENGRWSVTVRAVHKEGDAWVDVPREQERVHGTQPDARELKAGPVQRAEAPPAPAATTEPDVAAASKITDFGEKIGGARKDQATKAPKAAKPRSSGERPAWARRFEISQIAKSSRVGEEGRWVVRDARSLDALKQPRRVGAETYATREEAEQAVPLLAVAQKHRPVPLRGDGAGYEIWRDVSDRKRVKVVDQVFPTREAALEYMAQNAQAIIETNTTFGEADLPRPPSEERVGESRRTGDARDSDFMEVFGFRGVEFGNWNNQQERQQLLNDAYDGLLDLADVMGVPPRAISLDGDLALAFGARGHGLSSARAHYEPAKAVINLTKMNGAGSLAHEWFHALDHYFGRQDGKAPAEWVIDKDGTRSLNIHDAAENNMVSGGTRGERSGMRPELREAFAEVMRTIARKAEGYVEDTARADRFVASAREDVKRRLDTIRADLARELDPKYYKRFNKAATADQLAEFDSVAEKIVSGELLEVRLESNESARSIASGIRWTNDALNRLSAVMKAVRGRQGFTADKDGPLDRLRGLMQNYSARLKMLADAQGATEKTRAVPTEFVMNAKELDQGRGQDYWTRPHELAARAFQGYVEDKIAARGGRSPFLNYGPEGAVIPTPWGFKRPFPTGAERVAINKALDGLAATIKARESEAGGVALFRRGADDDLGAGMARELLRIMGKGVGFSPEAQRQAVESVRATVNPIIAAWRNAPEVVVAYDLNDPIIPQRVRDADLRQRSGGAHGAPEGFYYGGKAYLMASRLTTPEKAARVLFHEVAGHHGLRGLYGPELDKILNQVVTMRRAEVDAKMAEYGMRGVDRLNRQQAAEEVLAEMAEKNPQLSFVRRAVAAIRNFLRSHVPGFESLRMSDADIIQAYILPARGWVEREAAGREGAAGRAAIQYSLSQDDARSGFASEVRAAIAAGLANDERALRAQVPLGVETPAALEVLGVGRKPVVTNRNLIAKMHFEHGVPRADLERLGELLSNPVMVFKSDTQPGRMVVVTSLVVRGNPVVVAVDPNGASNRAEVVYVPSAYPKDNADRTFTRWIRDGLLQFAHKQESRQLATTARLQLPGVVQRAAGFRADYKTEADLPQSDGGPDVMFSRERIVGLKDSALEQITQTLSHPGKVSIWDKTIGTMRHLGERKPAFKPVFDSAQRFIDDVSMLGNDAADQAPRLLPRVDSWKDLRKKPISAADNKAVAKPLFEGTLLWARDIDGTPVQVDDLAAKYKSLPADEKAQLMLRGERLDPGVLQMWRGLPLAQYEAAVNTSFDSRVLKAGVVWSDEELQSKFSLDADQVSLYREGRAAIDRSIDMTARADMLRGLGEEYAGMRDAVLAQDSLDDAVELLTRTLMDDARDRPDMADRLTTLNNGVVKAQEKAQQLMDQGYAPLSRFGRYTVDVVDAAGERQYFGMFETMREANQMAERMEAEFQGAAVTQGTMSQDAFKLFAGVTPESLEMFGSMLGLDGKGDDPKDKAFQAYLQLAKNNHSALKRLIHRKGIAGYSEDVGRVLASFVYSNARLGAGGLNAGTMENAINAIPKEEGELKDLAMGLRDYIANPQEEGQAVRGMLFAQYLGGSLASAFVNMTQPFAVTLPWLTQFGGARKAGAQMAKALNDMRRSWTDKGFKYEADLAAALQSAEDDGVVSPQEIHQLMAQARGTGSLRTGDGTKAGDARAAAANNWERVKVAWGQPFALAEQFNRRSTFIAAYRIAKEQGMEEPSSFARKAVLETQFLYSKANKMRFARGAVGGTLMTFKTYSVSYLELMHRMWTQGGPEGKKAVGWAIAMLLLMSGAGGLPFMEDAEDLIDGAGQLMGYNVSAKQWRKQLLQDVVGKEFAEFMEQGISGLPGAPVDVSGRLGMGNLIPGTGLFLSKQNRERDLLEVAGPAGDLVARGFTAGRKVLTGDVGGAALELSPTAVRNAMKGADMAASGIYKDTKGYKVIDTTLAEAGAKFLGFQPKSVAEVQEANSFMQRTKSFYTQTSSEIKAQWADALFRKDEADLERVRERLADWNANNPDQPIVVKMPDVWKRVREMGKDRTQRIAETAPKALREQMREISREQRGGTV